MELIQSFGFWQYVGIALFLWVLFDLFAGYAYLYRKVNRSEEPTLYWFTMLIWTVVAASCFFGADYFIGT